MCFFRICTVLLFAPVWAGCATVFTGTTDEIRIESKPAGALIYLDGIEQGRTPAALTVRRPGISNTDVTLRLSGYKPRTFRLQKEFNAVSVINLTNPIFWAIDIATGAVTRYRPLGYYMELESEGRVLNLDDLPLDGGGRYLLPSGGETLVVQDPEHGLRLVFER